MPKGPVPDRYRDLLQSPALGHLATVGLDGRPQVNPVWFISDGEHVYLSIKSDTGKYRNLRSNPAVAMSVSDLSRPDRYVWNSTTADATNPVDLAIGTILHRRGGFIA